MSRSTVLTILWDADVAPMDALTRSRELAEAVSSEDGVVSARMQIVTGAVTDQAAAAISAGPRSGARYSGRVMPHSPMGTCSVCGDLVPIRPSAKGHPEYPAPIARDHYPADLRFAYDEQPHYYCRGGGQPAEPYAARTARVADRQDTTG